MGFYGLDGHEEFLASRLNISQKHVHTHKAREHNLEGDFQTVQTQVRIQDALLKFCPFDFEVRPTNWICCPTLAPIWTTTICLIQVFSLNAAQSCRWVCSLTPNMASHCALTQASSPWSSSAPSARTHQVFSCFTV